MEINYKNYNLRDRYNHWNETIFDNKLTPPPTVGFQKLDKNTHGIIYYRCDRIRRTKNVKWAKTTSIKLCTTIAWTQETLDAVLLHEMVHQYNLEVDMLDNGHDTDFHMRRVQFSKKSGVKIADGDSLPLRSNLPIKTLGYLKKYDTVTKKEYILFFNHMNISHAQIRMCIQNFSLVSQYGNENITFGVCRTNIHHRTPVKRKLTGIRTGRITWAGIQDSDMLEIVNEHHFKEIVKVENTEDGLNVGKINDINAPREYAFNKPKPVEAKKPEIKMPSIKQKGDGFNSLFDKFDELAKHLKGEEAIRAGIEFMRALRNTEALSDQFAQYFHDTLDFSINPQDAAKRNNLI